MINQNRNNLEFSNSPYLKQHADNPVHWNEWKREVLELAKKENKPIIVSIGYSTCHWCHVMAHESFEDADTAELMNEKFVCIKIDREERPDLDMFFMNACQLITGKGGWPLNVFCLPDGRPFHAGTYFQKEHWKQLLNQLSDAYKNRYEEVIGVAENLTQGIEKMDVVGELSSGSPEFTRQEIAIILEKFQNEFDQVEGGLSRVPKFPLPVVYHFLLNYYKHSGNKEVLNLINLTLIKMGSGGIYDHVRGGFARYSTDRYWKVPHFEKMLYDNAQLISLYSKAYSATQIPVYKSITEQSILFLETELTSENGLFQSALDADTDGVEGKYYVYTWAELQSTLGDDLDTFSKIYNCTEVGNWEHGLNILYIVKSPAELVSELNMPLVLIEELKKRSFEKLKVLQEHRTRPGLDYKVISSWNALMVKGLCAAYDCFKKENYLIKAVNCAKQFSDNIHQIGFLPRIINIKNSDLIPGFLDDYAYWTDAFLVLYHATFDERWLFEARNLLNMATEKFGDEKSKLLWYSENGKAEIASRSRDLTDDVTPSSNSVMALSMQKIGYLFGDIDLINRSHQMFASVNKQFSTHPAWYSNWGNIALSQGYGFVQVCCTGPNAVDNANQLKPIISDNSLLITDEEGSSEIPLIIGKFKESQSLIYICYNQTCFEPVTNIEDALVILEDCGYDLAR